MYIYIYTHIRGREGNINVCRSFTVELTIVINRWGWLVFNCGSSFGVTHQRWMYASRAAVTTINASVGGGVVGIFYT